MDKMKTEVVVENQEKTFRDLTKVYWYQENGSIKFGESISSIVAGKFETLEIKEFLSGEGSCKWSKILITKDNQFCFLKKGKELK
jgi:hypothetical protein